MRALQSSWRQPTHESTTFLGGYVVNRVRDQFRLLIVGE
jgi:hypothetical protein